MISHQKGFKSIVYYIDLHEFKHTCKNNYPVPFITNRKQILKENPKYMFDKKITFSDDPIHKIVP